MYEIALLMYKNKGSLLSFMGSASSAKFSSFNPF